MRPRTHARHTRLTSHSAGRILSAVLIALSPALAHAGGGAGGNTSSSGGTDSASGPGSAGSDATAIAGGGGGGAGTVGGVAGSGFPPNGAGGAGGQHGFSGAALPSTTPTAAVGGSDGLAGVDHGGGGGAGGWGAVVTGTGNLGTLSVDITGARGGNGGVGTTGVGGAGGSGGIGLSLTDLGAKTLTVDTGRSITGGDGGNGGSSGNTGGLGGIGGVGLSASNLTLTNNGTIAGGDGGNLAGTAFYWPGGAGVTGSGLSITNAGTISGGRQGLNQTFRANAITFTGGINSLTLYSTSNIVGNVVAASSADTLVLGGTAAGSFNMSNIGAAQQYQGFGKFQKTGDSTWTLAGTNATSMAYLLSGGTLKLSSAGALGTQGVITFNGGTLQFGPNNTTDYSSRFSTTSNQTIKVDTNGQDVFFNSIIRSNSGTFTKLGSGVLFFTADNTYTNGTTISGGTLQVGNGTATGSIGTGDVINNGAVVFSRTAPLTMPGSISGTGTLEQRGSGTLILTGNNTYTGGTWINFGGTLQVGNGGATGTIGSGDVTNAGSLVFNRTGPLSVAGNVTGTGSVTLSGTGTIVLGGTNNTYTGTTTVNAGTLVVDGKVTASAITVNDGGTLSGTGKIGDPVINAGGTLSPGSAWNPLGTLTLADALLMRAGSFFAVTIGPNGNSKVALTNGATASIDGAILKANFRPGTYIEKQYTVMSGGNITGKFANTIVTTNLPAGFTTSASYTPTSALLNLTAVLAQPTPPSNGSSGASIPTSAPTTAPLATGFNPNQQAVANALNGAFNNGGSLPAAFTQIYNLTGPALSNALTQLSPQIFTQARSGAAVSGVQFTSALLSCRVPGGDTAVVMREGQCLWARAKESVTSVNSTDTDVGRRTRTNSFQAGAQVSLGQGWTLGGAIGYDQSWMESDTTSGNGDRVNAGLALKYTQGSLQLVGSLSGGWGSLDSRRAVTVPGLLGTLRGSSDVDTYTAHARAAYLIDYGTWYLKPLVDMNIMRLDFSGLTESGGAAALQIAGSRDFIASVSPALEFGTNIALSRNVSLRPFLRTGLTWGDQGSLSLDASFIGAPQTFTTTTTLDRVAADVALGFDIVARSGAAFRFEYEGRYGETTTTSSFIAKGSLPF